MKYIINMIPNLLVGLSLPLFFTFLVYMRCVTGEVSELFGIIIGIGYAQCLMWFYYWFLGLVIRDFKRWKNPPDNKMFETMDMLMKLNNQRYNEMLLRDLPDYEKPKRK